jgi:hypothetical protein
MNSVIETELLHLNINVISKDDIDTITKRIYQKIESYPILNDIFPELKAKTILDGICDLFEINRNDVIHYNKLTKYERKEENKKLVIKNINSKIEETDDKLCIWIYKLIRNEFKQCNYDIKCDIVFDKSNM